MKNSIKNWHLITAFTFGICIVPFSFSDESAIPGSMNELAPGAYEIGPLESVHSEFMMVLENDVNDKSRRIGLIFPVDLLNKMQKPEKGFIVQVRPIKDGKIQMVSRLQLNSSGNLMVQSEKESNAPVIEIAHREDHFKIHPYILIFRGKDQEGKIMGMKPVSTKISVFQTTPVYGVYVSSGESKAMLSVQNEEVFEQSRDSFRSIAINGSQGHIAGLSYSRLDAISEQEIGNEKIQKTIFFLGRAFGKESVILATPEGTEGEMKLNFFNLVDSRDLDRWREEALKRPKERREKPIQKKVAPTEIIGPRTQTATGLYVGGRIMDSRGDCAKIQEIFSDGRLSVQYDKYWSNDLRIVYSRDVTYDVPHYLNFSIGTLIIDGAGDRGKVVELFNDGRLVVRSDFSGYNDHVTFASDVATLVPLLRGFSRGMRVVNLGNDRGTVSELLSNGKIVVRYDGTDHDTVALAHTLSAQR